MEQDIAQRPPAEDFSMKALLPLVYGELRTLASKYLDQERPQTLQPTALVHEAYVRMVKGDGQWSGRDHFMAVAAIAMRHVLVDHARKRKSDKRGGGAARADLSIAEAKSAGSGGSTREMRVLELDDLLSELSKADPRAARVAEMRLFGGMSQEQIASVLEVSRMTVTTDWQFARSWMASRVYGEVHVRVKGGSGGHA